MATNNGVNTGLSGTTGTGNFVGSNSPTLVTPALGTPSALIITNATGDKLGTTTNDNAAVGHVGEFVSSEVAQGSAVSLTTATATNITSISLTAGDWDVWGNVLFIPANTTVMSSGYGSIGASSATIGATVYRGSLSATSFTGDGSKTPSVTPGQIRISISSTTTIYLVAYSDFITSTNAAFGYIYARRVR